MGTKLFKLTFALLANLSISLCIFAQAQSTFFPATGPVLMQSIKISDPGAGLTSYAWSPATYMYNDIGRADDGTYYNRYRMRTVLNFGSIPRDARINSVKLTLTIWNYTSGSSKARIVKLPANYSSDANAWSQFDSPSAVYFTDLQYDKMSNKDLTNPTFTSDVTNVINSTNPIFTFGIISLNEGTNGTDAQVIMSVTVNWTPKVTVTVQNSFSGGTVEVDGVIKNSPWTSGQSGQPTWYSGDSHNIRAYTQTISSVTYQYPEPGNWSSTCGQHMTQSNNNTPVSISPTSNCTMTANFAMPVTVKNNFPGGSITIDGITYTNVPENGITNNWVQNSTHTLTAIDNQDVGNYVRVFDRWTSNITNDPVTYQLSKPITVTQTATYTANFLKLFNVSVTNALFIEPGIGGSYKVDGVDVGANWQGTFKEGTPTPIKLKAVPPPGYVFVGWSDGEKANPRNLSPTDHLLGLYAMYKIPMKSNMPTAISGNTQRKLTSDGSSLWLSYESAGRIFLTESTNSGRNWLPESFISEGSKPSISSSAGGSDITFEKTESNQKSIYWRRYSGVPTLSSNALSVFRREI